MRRLHLEWPPATLGLHLDPLAQWVQIFCLIDTSMLSASPLPQASLALRLAASPGLQRSEGQRVLEL